ncbi:MULTISPECIES: hypothetical protein [unclassified Pseudoxanthomonas]|uniref:hypothetical protein n=1 Tax=unclassified Pseudoxanthomonas TaxID=2645906 RepID=UPI00307D74A5
MKNEEAVARIHALDAWVSRYPRSNTFRQFWKDYDKQDLELAAFLSDSDRGTWDEGVHNALNMLGEGMDTSGFMYSRDRPYRRINEGPSYGDGRDELLDDLYKTVAPDPNYVMSDAIRAVFDPIKERLHSEEWTGKPRRQQLDWLDRELQDLISRIQTPKSAAIVHAYLFDFVDQYDVEGADLDAPIPETNVTNSGLPKL